MRTFSPTHLVLALLAAAFLPGCNYVHFGRLDQSAGSDSALVVENTDLRLEKKILQQELAIARKEGDALREALKNSSTSSIGNQTELAFRLQEAAKELGSLRAVNARLQAERAQLQNARGSTQNSFAASQEITDLKARLSLSEGKLAQTIENYTKFERENADLRREVTRVRGENSKLEQQVNSLTLQNEQAIAALSQLNNELLAQKAARQRAEDNARSTQTQLQMVLAGQQSGTPASLGETRQSSAAFTSELSPTPTTPEAAPARENKAALTLDLTPAITASENPTAILRTSPERLKGVTVIPEQEKPGVRYHIVEEGDTLGSVAEKYYGKPNLWRLIYVANNSLLGGARSLKPGMKLEIPPQ